MTLFHLLRPEYLPAGITLQPEIEIVVIEYPVMSVRMQYEGEQGEILLFSQEKTTGNMKRNIFVPENVECREISVENRKILFIEQDAAINAQWIENGIHYYMRTFGIKKEDVLKIIKTLQ